MRWLPLLVNVSLFAGIVAAMVMSVVIARGMESGSVEAYLVTMLAGNLSAWAMLFARNIVSFSGESEVNGRNGEDREDSRK